MDIAPKLPKNPYLLLNGVKISIPTADAFKKAEILMIKRQPIHAILILKTGESLTLLANQNNAYLAYQRDKMDPGLNAVNEQNAERDGAFEFLASDGSVVPIPLKYVHTIKDAMEYFNYFYIEAKLPRTLRMEANE